MSSIPKGPFRQRFALIGLLAAASCPALGATTQEAYLKALNSDGWDRFGISVAISGDTAIVGAHEEDSAARGVNGDGASDTSEDSGAAYIFVRGADGRWTQQAYLKASNADDNDNFGQYVAIDGNYAVVGARQEDGASSGVNGSGTNNGSPGSGAAYIFKRDSNGNWTQDAYLKASNNRSGISFGCSVAISGTHVIVGAASESTGAGSSGAAYIFSRSRSGWSQRAFLKASNTDAVDTFGTAVAISGGLAIVGAPFEDSSATGVDGNQSDNSAATAGAAYVFARTSSSVWTQEAYLKASNAEGGDRFGEAVAISGETAVVGARWEKSISKGVNGDESDNSQHSTGAAYVFARDALGRWSQEAYLKPSNSDAYDFFFFGTSVGVSGDDVVIGAPGEGSSATGVHADQYADADWWNGAVYQFRRDASGEWSQAAYIKSSNCRIDDRFASSVAISDGTVIAGAIGEDSAATGVGGDQTDFKTNGEWVGASYIFDITRSDPGLHITDCSRNGSLLTVRFRSDAGLDGWAFQGAANAQVFADALAPDQPVVETSPGHYTATVDLGPEPPDRYFVRVLRE